MDCMKREPIQLRWTLIYQETTNLPVLRKKRFY